jgi:iron complex outermembrane receptor protein
MNTSYEKLLTFRPLAVLLVALAMEPSHALAAEVQSQEIVVKGKTDTSKSAFESKKMKSSDTAALLEDTAGVNVQSSGGVSGLPVMNGLADDRLLVYMDNMIICSACANHMNPPLSYMPSSSVGSIYISAGLVPVSKGGDSIGGMIQVESEPPLFAMEGDGIRTDGVVSSYFRSNNKARGVSIGTTVASSRLSLGITASHDRADDYRDGNGQKITSTYYESNNIALTLGYKTGHGLLTIKGGHQMIPDQGFTNEWMDMIDNDATYLSASYDAKYDWGRLETDLYWHNTWHKMDSGQDKLPIALTPPVLMPYMPMITRGINIGYTIRTEYGITENETLRVGHEFQRFTLNDIWPPVTSSVATMGPETFVNINDGKRDRYGVYAELESKWSDSLKSTVGVRGDFVSMNTGNVQGYNSQNVAGTMTTNYLTDSTAFNAQDHSRNDSNLDLCALLQYEHGESSSYEFGYTRKTRSPNLYERYAWSTMYMTSAMINWFGDGNGYVGNLNLRPEVAHTFSVSGQWRDHEKNKWELKVTPYFTHVHDYIDVEWYKTQMFPSSTITRNVLRFANHNAELYGINVSGSAALWKSDGLGDGRLFGTLGYVHGKDLDNGDGLYHMMPLNARVSVEQKISGWSNSIEMQLVGRKSEVDPLRFEPETSSYCLLSVATAYDYKNLRIDAGVMNLFDTSYDLPLGGINYDDFLVSKRKAPFEALAGQGRSFTIGLTQRF